MKNWAFDAKRKKGDVEIVKTSYGYHIMYFEAVGDPVWKISVKAAMKEAEYTELFEDLEKKYEVKFNNKVLEDIPVIVFRTSSASAS